MRKVTDSTGLVYKLIEEGEGKVRLQSEHFSEISHVYKEEFIEAAIQNGVLIPLPEQTEMKFKIGEARG